MMAEDIIRTIHTAKYGQNICYLGPTLQQSKELIWQPICDRLYELGWDYTPVVSKSRIELSRGRKIYVLGAEKIERVRGHKFLKAYMDEVAFFSHPLKEIWRALRPTLSDYKGGAIVATTPNGKGTDAYDFFSKIRASEFWTYHSWTTSDNPFIDLKEIEDAKRELDEKSFQQEYMATWESFIGLAYYNFDENIHIVKQPPIDFDTPLHIALDFNVNPTTLLLSQYDKSDDMMRYKKEYSFANSSTEATIKAFCDDHRPYVDRLKIKVRGDSAGNNRSSNTGKSDYHYVEEMLKHYGFSYTREVLPKNPAIVDRVKTANGWLKPVKGRHRVEIDPSMVELIRDLSSQELDGRHPSDKNNRGHKADAWGYDIYYQSLMASATQQKGTYYL